jgi:hypothetical protein
MAVLNNLVPFSFLAWGQTQIASGLASVLDATTPLFTVLRAPRDRHPEHRRRLFHLLSHPVHGGRDEPPARDVPDSGERTPAGNGDPR